MAVRCTGITKAGVQCAKIATRSLGEEGERQWCATHCPEEAVKNVPRCAGLARNGMPCGSACEYIVVFRDEEVTVCRQHWRVHEESDGKTLQTPPKPRTPKSKRLAQETTLVGETKGGNGGGSLVRPPANASLRERLVTTTEEMYGAITGALEDVITNAKKRRATACPSCGHRFSVLIPDYGAIVNAANALLAKTVNTSGSLEEETARLDAAPPEALTEMSTADLRRLLRGADWSYAQAQAEAETLEETITRHLDTLLDYTETKDPALLPRAQHSKREVQRLRAIHERLALVVNADLPLLPGESEPYEGPRPSFNPVPKTAADG